MTNLLFMVRAGGTEEVERRGILVLSLTEWWIQKPLMKDFLNMSEL